MSPPSVLVAGVGNIFLRDDGFGPEVIRHLGESGALFEEGGRWTYRGPIAQLGIPDPYADRERVA